MTQKPALERAARALCELAGNPPMATMEGKPLWMDYLPEARAVLTAVRKPDQAMKDAAYAEGEKHHAQFDISPDDIWEVMIDAALEKRGA